MAGRKKRGEDEGADSAAPQPPVTDMPGGRPETPQGQPGPGATAEAPVGQEAAAEMPDPAARTDPQGDDMPQPAAPDPEAAPETGTETGTGMETGTEPEPVAPADPDDRAEAASGSDGAEPRGGSAAPAAAPVAPAAPRRRGGFVPLVAGGMIAAGLGAGAALYLAPQFLPRPDDSAIETLRAEVGLQQTRLDQIAGDVTAIRGDDRADRLAAELAGLREELSAAMQPLADRVAALETQGDALARRLDAMETRIVTLEKRPVEGGQASATALEAFGREMEALRAEMAAQRQQSAEVEAQIKAAAARAAEEIARAEERAGQLARQSEAARAEATFEAGLARLRAALDAGTPLDAALADLAKAGVAVPEILQQNATGVPTIAALRDSFADAARAALAASIKVGADAGPWERFTAFLRNQTQARSLTPRAGDDPDAVLSRAEAALRAGDLAMALSELEALPPEGRAKMAEWVARANRRLEVERAVDALAPSSQ